MELDQRVVVITGASSGIGAATALRCAGLGARLVLAARSTEQLEALAQQVTQAGGQALAIPTDVADQAQVQRLAATASQHYGHVDVLVNNAGIGLLDPFPQAQIADLQQMIQVNLFGVVHCTQAVLPHMFERRQGQIVNVASLAGLVATRNMAFYSATKFALIGMSRALQYDLRGTGVRCAVICPGIVRTPFFTADHHRKLARMARFVPSLKADDVASAIVHAIQRDRSGEIMLPPYVRPLIVIGRAFPGLARLTAHLLGD